MTADFSIQWKGTNKLKRHFAEAVKLDLAKQVVKTNGAEMQRKMVENTSLFTGSHRSDGSVIPGTPTGATKRSITGGFEDNGLTYRGGPTTAYAMYPNFGTRFMRARPFVTNAFNDQKMIFISDMNKVMR